MRIPSCCRAARFVFAAALALSLASPALAAETGVNLGWDHCGVIASNVNKDFDCDDDYTSFTLVSSFRTGIDIPDFVAVSAALYLATDTPALPDWFSFGAGGCREADLSLVNVGVVAGCTNPYAGAYQGGGFIVDPGPAPNRVRIRLDWACDMPRPVRANELYTAFVFTINSARSSGGEAGACAGCGVPASIELAYLELWTRGNGYTYVDLLESPIARNWVTWQGGPPGDPESVTPARQSTWGQVKALYR